jgi:hypothetical protein
VTTYAINRDHPTFPEPLVEAFDTQFEPAPIAEITNALVSTISAHGVGSAPRMRVAEADARIAVFGGVRVNAQGGATIQTLQPRERRAAASTHDIRHFVASARSGVSNAVIDRWMLADGFFELRPLYIGNPWEPYLEQLTASAEQTVILHRESQSHTIMRGSVKVHRSPGNPSIRILTQNSWQGAVTLRPSEIGLPVRPTLDYSEIMRNVATVPVGEAFALEFRLRAEVKAGDEAADWIAVADLYNTAGYTVQSETPGVEIMEVTPRHQSLPRLNYYRTGNALWLEWDAPEFYLQSGPASGGPWIDHSGASSPFPVQSVQPFEMFRLKRDP